MKIKNLKKTFALATSALALSAAFVGCSDYCEFTAADLKMEKINKDYDEAFIKKFGGLDPTQTWGMDDILNPIAGGKLATRSVVTGSVNSNRNQWCERYDNDGSHWNGTENVPHKKGDYKVDSYCIAHDIKVPGWPNDDGLYYGSNGAQALSNIWQESQLTNSCQPVGDVTDYEIQYVSAWFRTHRAGTTDFNNAKVNLHLSDFFIQNVSCDVDQATYDANLSHSSYGYNGRNLQNVDDAIANAEIKNISKLDGKESSNERLNYDVDQLCFGAIGCDEENLNGDGWTHINNFNSQLTNHNPEESETNPNRTIMYVTSSGTENFACRAAMASNKNAWMDEWVLVHLTWQETMADGNTYLREGYYLAFDFTCLTQETQILPDGYYSNWIVKITPAHFNNSSDRVRRVFCEDLGGTYDFDFNDIVFDIAFDTNGDAIISTQAAGGTMPIWIDKDPRASSTSNETPNNPKYEVHRLLGAENGDMTPINVDNRKTHSVAIFRSSGHSDKIISNVHVYVKNTQNANGKVYDLTGGLHERVNISPDSEPDDEQTKNDLYDQNNPFGSSSTTIKDGDEYTRAPRAFSTPITVPWMRENQDIVTSYPVFAKWVQNVNYSDDRVNAKKWYDFADNLANRYIPNTNTGTGTIDNSRLPTEWVPLSPWCDQDGGSHIAHELHSLKLGAYTGPDPIYEEFDKTDNPATQVTFTIVLNTASKLTEGQKIEAILVPADIENNVAFDIDEDGTYESCTRMSYKGNPFLTYCDAEENYTFDKLKDGVIKSYKEANFQEHYQSVVNDGVESYPNGYYYVAKFSFTKDQLMTNSSKYIDYIFLYVKTPNGVTVDIPFVETSTSNPKKREWYIHY